jgi:hypothetical protein
MCQLILLNLAKISSEQRSARRGLKNSGYQVVGLIIDQEQTEGISRKGALEQSISSQKAGVTTISHFSHMMHGTNPN